MNSIERVRAAIRFNNPDRVPVFEGLTGDVLPMPITSSMNWQPGQTEDEKGLFPHAISYGSWKWDEPEWVKANPTYRNGNWKNISHEEIDEWGRIWNMSGRRNNIGHPGRPSLPDWSKYHDYMERFGPDPEDKTRYSVATNMRESLGKEKYRSIFLGLGPSDNAAGIRGFTNYLIDHKKYPEELKELLDHLTEYYVKIIKNTFKFGVNPHSFWIYDDLGEQSGPFFSPGIFNKFYEPVYRRIIEVAHRKNCEVVLHCCGKVDRLIPMFIEWGLDALEFDSPRMSGYADLKPYRGKISMWGCVNIQTIYTLGTPQECEHEVWHMIRNLGTKNGGFGAYIYPQPKDIKAPEENILAFKQGIKEYGDYSKIPPHWWKLPVPKRWKDDYDKDIVPPLPSI
ncbi:MAG: uroporphyrinogen decarboxylase family protein [Promethearchaeota archaeon]